MVTLPYTYKDKPILIEYADEIKVSYETTLRNGTIDFVNGIIRQTYQIVSVTYKRGVIKKITTLVNLVNGVIDKTYQIIEVIYQNKVVKKVIYLVGVSIFALLLRFGGNIASETPTIQPQKTPTGVVQQNKAQPGQEMKNSSKTSASVTKIVNIVGGGR